MSLCLAPLASNTIKLRNGRVRAICACCGSVSSSKEADERGELSMWNLPRDWSTAPYPADFVHDDGSTGSTFTCPSCNRRLRRGEALQRRAYLGDYSALLARAAIAKATGIAS